MTSFSSYSDQSLLRKVADGDEKAFRELLTRFGQMVCTFVASHCRSSELAEEIVQDVFTRVWLVRESLTELKSFEGFLYIISRNYAYDALRKVLKNEIKLKQYREGFSEHISEIKMFSESDWKMDLMDAAVQKLPPQQLKVWQLSRQERLRYAEIAARMKLSPETVKKYLQAATASIISHIQMHRIVILVFFVLSDY